jgi:hypothetical protein
MTDVALVGIGCLFGLKIIWNLSLPYVLAARRTSQGISLMPFVEVVLLGVGVVIGLGQTRWPAQQIGLYGGALIVVSYIHLAVMGAVMGALFRRLRSKHNNGDA